MASALTKNDLETICKKVAGFKCIRHKKSPALKIQDASIIVATCCNRFQDHIECFIEKQVEMIVKGIPNNV